MSQRETPSEFETAVEELKSAAIFLTRLPPRLIGATAAAMPDFRHGARVFPAVGALVGLVGGIVLVAADALGIPPMLAAALAVATTILITGGLHEDGLADTADSFGGSTTEKKLEIMDDSRVGSYGAAALVVSILVRVLALGAVAAQGSWRGLLVLVAAEAVSRAAMVRLWHDLPAARMGGLSNDTGAPDQNAMLVALAVAAVIAVVFALPGVGLWPTILAGALAIAGTYATIRLVSRMLGGRTGDTLGACQQVAVAAFLIGASAL